MEFFSVTCYSVRSCRQKAVTANWFSRQTIDARCVKLQRIYVVASSYLFVCQNCIYY